MKRRTVLVSILPAILASGCLGFGQRTRSLGFETVYIEQSSEGWELKGEVAVDARDAASDWTTFHSVRLIGYDTNGKSFCTANLGDIGPQDTKDVHIACDRIPPLITFTTEEEGPCTADTSIGVYEYRRDSEGVDYHRRRLRECDGPRLPTETVTID